MENQANAVPLLLSVYENADGSHGKEENFPLHPTKRVVVEISAWPLSQLIS